MTKRKTTKRALLGSALALLLCVSMLIGTTYAWFTDSVTSGKNRIIAGNLDVELEYEVKNDDGTTTWKPVEEDTDLFDGILWEPGMVVTQKFRVSNVGSLALKYALSVAVGDYNATEAGNALFEVITVGSTTDELEGRDAYAAVATGSLTEVNAAAKGELLPGKAGEDGDVFTVVLYWAPTDHDNDYNLKDGAKADDGEDQLYIDLGVNLVATQATVESDSFGNDYDEGAQLPETHYVSAGGAEGGVELKNTINNAKDGDTIVLTQDTIIAGYTANNQLVIDKAVTIDLNGNTLVTECGWGGISAKGGCSITNGTIHHTSNTAAIKAFQVETIENVDIIIDAATVAGKVIAGIVVQEGSGCYIGSIKDVTISGEGLTNGIETYNCGTRTEEHPYAIGSLENVIVDAQENGFLLSAPVGTATECEFKGGVYGIDMLLKGAYSVSIELIGSKVSGGNAGIYAHDEKGVSNPGTFTLIGDEDTVIEGGVTQDFGDEDRERITIDLKGGY